jgi:hypothetical protein
VALAMTAHHHPADIGHDIALPAPCLRKSHMRARGRCPHDQPLPRVRGAAPAWQTAPHAEAVADQSAAGHAKAPAGCGRRLRTRLGRRAGLFLLHGRRRLQLSFHFHSATPPWCEHVPR